MTLILFDSHPGGDDPTRFPVRRFRAIKYEGGPPPEFVPQWEEMEKLRLEVDWPSCIIGTISRPADVRVLPPREALGAIDGMFRRAAFWRRKRIYCMIACVDPQGEQWRQVRALYQMFEKPCPWRLRRAQVPDWARDEVRL